MTDHVEPSGTDSRPPGFLNRIHQSNKQYLPQWLGVPAHIHHVAYRMANPPLERPNSRREFQQLLQAHRDIAGTEEFCEVFLDGVRTHHTNLVGELNRGWTVAKSLLGFERIFLGSPKLPEYGLLVLESLARARGLLDDPVFNDRFMSLKLDVAHLADIYGHYAAIVSRGRRRAFSR